MKLARTGVMAAAVLAVAAAAWGQKPDFSGTWTLDPASASAGGGVALGDGPATVAQTAEALTVKGPMGDEATLTYKLDGSESRNMIPGPNGQLADSLSTAKWDGPRLTILTRQEVGGRLVEFTEVWRVEGSTLTVETSSARGKQSRVYRK
jgi:hypothetical protein